MIPNRTLLAMGLSVILLPTMEVDAQSITSRLERIRAKHHRHHRYDRHQRDRTADVMRLLNREIPAVSFDQETFEDVLDWFRAQGLKNIVVHWQKIEDAGDIDRATPVDLRVSDLTLGELLDLALSTVSASAFNPGGRLSYRIVNGLIRISTRADFADEIVVRTYDIENLLQALIFFDDAPTVSVSGGRNGGRGGRGGGSGGRGPGGGSGRGPGGGSGRGPGGGGPGSGGGLGGDGSIFEGGGGGLIDFQSIREEQLEKLMAVILSLNPSSWFVNSGFGTVSEFRGKLIIAQTIEMHELIGGTFRLRAGKS
ncbi:MAG: hypothetical protein IIA33_04815 [Planctomycetes bacterium]|nr:hypothetical protein [Planctomycetota bacterium]